MCSVFHKSCINLPVQLCHNEQKNILTKRLILGAFTQKWRLIPWWGTIWGGSGEWFCSKSLAVLAARGGPIRYWQYCERCFYILFFSPCIKMWITETDGLYVTIGTFKIQVVFLFGVLFIRQQRELQHLVECAECICAAFLNLFLQLYVLWKLVKCEWYSITEQSLSGIPFFEFLNYKMTRTKMSGEAHLNETTSWLSEEPLPSLKRLVHNKINEKKNSALVFVFRAQ